MPTVQARSRSGKKLGSFEILEEIGQGGMGVVYLARQPALDRYVVVKKMLRDLAFDPSMVERFEREARAAATVHHQNVVAVYDCFTMRGDHYIAEEYVDGPDLRTVLDECKRFEPRIAALIGLEIIRGLEEIHARGIVHRDLKPGNVLLGRGGETKIADFGIALDGKAFGLTRPGTLMGSVPYLSPEQMLGERVDYRSDLFVFGILLYEMLTGAPPFEESDEDDNDTLLERMQNGRYVSPRERNDKVPRYLARVIHRCLQAKPAKRIASATLLRRQLERWLGRISPADCRRQIAAWLWERGLIQPAEGQIEGQPAATQPKPAWANALRRPAARWFVPAAIAIVLIGMGLGANAIGLFSTESTAPVEPDTAPTIDLPSSSTPAPPASRDLTAPEGDADIGAAPILAPAPAQVRFTAWPWARVEIEDRVSFLTPRAQPVELPPGEHVIVFEHPSFGEAEYRVVLTEGEERLVSHFFQEAPRP